MIRGSAWRGQDSRFSCRGRPAVGGAGSGGGGATSGAVQTGAVGGDGNGRGAARRALGGPERRGGRAARGVGAGVRGSAGTGCAGAPLARAARHACRPLHAQPALSRTEAAPARQPRGETDQSRLGHS